MNARCGDDKALLAEVQALLLRHGQAGSFLEHGPAVVAAPNRLEPGTWIGQYEIIREIGHGGMGVVYLARDTKLGRRVAIKLVNSTDPGLVARFILEAKTTARTSHENIVVIHDVDEYDGHPFIVLEYLKGQSLSAVLHDEGRLPPGRAVQLIVPVVRALVCAHQHRIVHRDLKPANVFLTRSGGVKVLDFGIAKVLVPRADGAVMESPNTTVELTIPHLGEATHFSVRVGTVTYMSPEQWLGVDVDHQTDLWAVGIILYRMVTGAYPLAPLRGEQLAVTSVLAQPMPSVRDAGVDLPDALAEIIDRCLKKRKGERIRSAGALLDALEALLPGRPGGGLTSGTSPYAGLAPFQESDAGRFFGRGQDVATMLAWLREQPLVAVVGPSGVGKSSFVQAGVIPSLKQSGEEWETHVIRPGRQPLTALASMLAGPMADRSPADPPGLVDLTIHAGEPSQPEAPGRPRSSRDEMNTPGSSLDHPSDPPRDADEAADEHDVLHQLYAEPGTLGTVLRGRARAGGGNVLLFVDQFEELYTLVADPRERKAFTRCLLGAADDATTRVRVVLSLRSDFLDRVAEDRAFLTELHRGLYFLTAPDREGLSEALTQPARLVGYRFESPMLVEQMLDAMDTTPGSLPLLQFTAAKLWEARDTERKLLTEQSYDAIGGMGGALASHALSVMNSLSPAEHGLVRDIFLHLVTAERTRAIATASELQELAAGDQVERLVERMVEARLLIVQSSDEAAGASVEIVHESLIDSWPMLSHWLDEHAEDIAFLEQLRGVAKGWDGKGRPTGLLWRGEAMEEARRWHRRYRGKLTALQREYLDAVFGLAARSARTKRIAVAGTIAFLSLLVVAASIALVLIRGAETDARAAAAEARAAENKVKEQLAVIQAKERDKRRAERAATVARKEADEAGIQVEQSKEQLRQTNADLRAALAAAREAEAVAKRESNNAKEAAARANAASERARQANTQLTNKLEEEKQRLNQERQEVARLKKKLGAKVGTGLKR